MKLQFLFLCCCLVFSCLSFPRTPHFTYINSSHAREKGHIRRVYIDDTFGNADLVSIQEALDQWQYALNGYLRFKTARVDLKRGSMDPLEQARMGQAWVFIKIDSHNALVDFHDRPELKALAFTDKIGGNFLYLVRDRESNDLVRGLTIHEIGHLLGAKHREDDNLMNPVYQDDSAQCVDQETLEQVAVYQHFPVENMNYCVYLNDQETK